MSTESFHDVRRRVIARHAAGDYAGALEIARAAGREYPEAADRTTYWIACLLSRLGEVERALEALEDGSRRGLWWGPATLEADPDLEPLHDDARFRAIVEAGRRAHAAAPIRPPRDPLVKTASGRPRALLVVLHGRGMRAEDVVDQWAGASDVLLVAPHSTQSFDMRTDCWDDAAIGEADVSRAVEQAHKDFPEARPPLIVGGFSQGAGLAVILAGTGRLPGVHGCIAVAPSASWASEIIGTPRPPEALRVVVLVGALEPRLEDCQRLVERLRSAGADVRLDVAELIGHDYPADFARRLPVAVDWALARDR